MSVQKKEKEKKKKVKSSFGDPRHPCVWNPLEM